MGTAGWCPCCAHPGIRCCPGTLPMGSGLSPSSLECMGSCKGLFLSTLLQGQQGWCERLRKPVPAKEQPPQDREQGSKVPAWPLGEGDGTQLGPQDH